LGIAKKVDFAFAGPQSLRVSQLLEDGKLDIGRDPPPTSNSMPVCSSI